MLYQEQVSVMSDRELRATITSGDLGFDDCLEMNELRARAVQALERQESKLKADDIPDRRFKRVFPFLFTLSYLTFLPYLTHPFVPPLA